MARLFAGENFDLPAVVELRQLGHDIVRVQDVGLAGMRIRDEDVLAHAIKSNGAVITFNRKDYVRLHRIVKPHHGIIICTHDRNYHAFALRIDQALASLTDLTNLFIRINRPAKP